MKRKFSVVITTVLLVVLLLCSINVSAIYSFTLTGNDLTYMSEVLQYVNDSVCQGRGLNEVTGYVAPNNTINQTALPGTLFYVNTVNNEYVFNKYVYEGLPKKKRKEVMLAFREAVVSKPFSVEAKQKLYYALSEQDDSYILAAVDDLFKSDGATALGYINKIAPIIQKVIGVISFIILILFVATLFLDFAYINIPILNTKFVPTERNFASKAAREAVIEQCNTNNSADVNLIYIKKKIIGVIVFSIILYVMLSGKLGDIIVFLLGVFV